MIAAADLAREWGHDCEDPVDDQPNRNEQYNDGNDRILVVDVRVESLVEEKG